MKVQCAGAELDRRWLVKTSCLTSVGERQQKAVVCLLYFPMFATNKPSIAEEGFGERGATFNKLDGEVFRTVSVRGI